MLNHTYIQSTVLILFLAPFARTTRYEKAFFPLENQEKKARFARASHYNKECISGMNLKALSQQHAPVFCLHCFCTTYHMILQQVLLTIIYPFAI